MARSWWSRPVVLSSAQADPAARSTTSDLPGFEIDAGIDPHIGEVRDQVHDERDQREDKQGAEHHRVVAIQHALEAEQAKTAERKDRLDQQRAGEERVNEGAWKSRYHDQHGVG